MVGKISVSTIIEPIADDLRLGKTLLFGMSCKDRRFTEAFGNKNTHSMSVMLKDTLGNQEKKEIKGSKLPRPLITIGLDRWNSVYTGNLESPQITKEAMKEMERKFLALPEYSLVFGMPKKNEIAEDTYYLCADENTNYSVIYEDYNEQNVPQIVIKAFTPANAQEFYEFYLKKTSEKKTDKIIIPCNSLEKEEQELLKEIAKQTKTSRKDLLSKINPNTNEYVYWSDYFLEAQDMVTLLRALFVPQEEWDGNLGKAAEKRADDILKGKYTENLLDEMKNDETSIGGANLCKKIINTLEKFHILIPDGNKKNNLIKFSVDGNNLKKLIIDYSNFTSQECSKNLKKAKELLRKYTGTEGLQRQDFMDKLKICLREHFFEEDAVEVFLEDSNKKFFDYESYAKNLRPKHLQFIHDHFMGNKTMLWVKITIFDKTLKNSPRKKKDDDNNGDNSEENSLMIVKKTNPLKNNENKRNSLPENAFFKDSPWKKLITSEKPNLSKTYPGTKGFYGEEESVIDLLIEEQRKIIEEQEKLIAERKILSMLLSKKVNLPAFLLQQNNAKKDDATQNNFFI